MHAISRKGQIGLKNHWIIRNYTCSSLGVLITVANRSESTIHGPQLTKTNFKSYFIGVLLRKWSKTKIPSLERVAL